MNEAPNLLKVNMLKAARDAQWDPDTFFGPGTIKALAPAKVNLFLGVHERDANTPASTKHEVDTVMHALALHDTLYVHVAPLTQDELASFADTIVEGDLARALVGPNGTIAVTVDMADTGGIGAVPARTLDVSAQDNLVTAAIDTFARAVDMDAPTAVQVRVEKAIPAQAGLGGGSSDAAAILLALAQAGGIPRDDARLQQAAQTLGADVAFFLHGGCALFEGEGDTFAHALEPMRSQVVIVMPDLGVSTASAYAAYDESPVVIPPEIAQAAHAATSAADVPLFNNLTAAAQTVCPKLIGVNFWLESQPGVVKTLLCGSGAATFAIMDSVEAAMNLTSQAMARGLWSRATSFTALGAAILPAR